MSDREIDNPRNLFFLSAVDPFPDAGEIDGRYRRCSFD
ncbi:hypothetical protein UCMB321_2291 [Pseudomonas batumici]|uniref:Uncharacterized protein n=1 Tax=Pseudomonas batumici TaxID=226910 RepID=A0A0C2ED87_9PSED|nr:hypothetical protein UCMB321_2291 [Pseudomonas batumici]